MELPPVKWIIIIKYEVSNNKIITVDFIPNLESIYRNFTTFCNNLTTP